MIDLSGKVALITGGSRGIGAATARLFARAGARVALTYRTRSADADRVVREIETESKGNARPVAVALAANLAESASNVNMVAETLTAFGRLDFFVANAGIWPPDPVELARMPEDHWRTTIAANLDSVFLGCRAVIPKLSEGGAIVIVSSTAGQRGEAFHADYAATKGAVISLVKSLAIELAPRATVNTVAPGWVDTEMVSPAMAGGERSRIESGIPLRRIASAEDIAGPILFLWSPLARHITGEVLNVNGGSVMCG